MGIGSPLQSFTFYIINWSPEKLELQHSTLFNFSADHKVSASEGIRHYLVLFVKCTSISFPRIENVSFSEAGNPNKSCCTKIYQSWGFILFIAVAQLFHFAMFFSALNTGKSGNYFYCSNDSLDSLALSSQSV